MEKLIGPLTIAGLAMVIILSIVSKNPLTEPMPPALPLNPAEFTAQFDAAAQVAGFRIEPYGTINGYALSAYTKRTPGIRPRVYLSAGIHGDEPAPPFALLRLLETGVFNARCNWFICPLINPIGFTLGTRENHAKVDLNRDYRAALTTEVRDHIAWLKRQPNFDLMICVHEDWESLGFYLYEINPDSRPTLAAVMLDAARMNCPIDPATVIDGREIAAPGIIRPVGDPLLRETWPEAIYLRHHHGKIVYTTETPSALPLAQRVATNCSVLTAALNEFCALNAPWEKKPRTSPAT